MTARRNHAVPEPEVVMSHATYRPAEIEAIVRTAVTRLDDKLAAGEIDQDACDRLQRVTAVWAEGAYALLPTSRYAGKPANARCGLDHLTGSAIPAAIAALLAALPLACEQAHAAAVHAARVITRVLP